MSSIYSNKIAKTSSTVQKSNFIKNGVKFKNKYSTIKMICNIPSNALRLLHLPFVAPLIVNNIIQYTG